MSDYEALDLSSLCNTGLEGLDGGAEVLVGRQLLRGLPFQIGRHQQGSKEPCFVELGGGSDGVTVSVNQKAHHVIFAHRLLESELLEGGMPGKVIAEYAFSLSGGDTVVVPIRERYEIGALPRTWGLSVPFLALTDQKTTLQPRYRGPWRDVGYRQTGTGPGLDEPVNYYLWAWKNPEPEREIESVRIVPGSTRFIIAGVTLGHLDEHPFKRQGLREVRIMLTDPERAERPFGLEVEVDRGDATYPYPLPQDSDSRVSRDSLPAWGEEANPGSSPSYVEIAATPSATVAISQNGQGISKFRWGELEERGRVIDSQMRVELLDTGRNWVRTTVLDEDTGRPVSCRIHFRSREGIPYQPHGHHNHLNSNLGSWHVDVGGDVRLGQTTYAYIDGACQGWLPRGEVVVEIARGFEYEPLRTTVNISSGQRELTLRMKRWIDMNQRRWFSGDSHVHFLSTQGSHLESQGEDLNVVNLLQSQWGKLFTNTEDFTGAPSVSRSGNNIVYVSQENRQHLLGHAILWGLKESVMPWCTDGPTESELGGAMETTLSYWADEAHAQGGTVILPHFPAPNGEPAALIATGRVDGVEMARHTKFSHLEYYRYLNCGYRVPLVAGTDKMSGEVPVGLYRTYAYVPEEEEFNYDSWREAVVRGRTFATGGPIIHLSVEGRRLGDTVEMSGEGTVEVEAWVESIFPIHSLEIVQAGHVVASTMDSNGTRRLALKTKVKITGHTWLAARAGGPDYFDTTPHNDEWRRGIFAHTSPIYVACGGEWGMFDGEAAQYMLTLIDGSLTYIRDTAAHYAPGTVTHHHGEDDHEAYLRRPLLEAQRVIQDRIDRVGSRR